jgi:hypothetical protein
VCQKSRRRGEQSARGCVLLRHMGQHADGERSEARFSEGELVFLRGLCVAALLGVGAWLIGS